MLNIPEKIRCDKGVQTKFFEMFDFEGSSSSSKSKHFTGVPSDDLGVGQIQNPFRLSPPLGSLRDIDIFDKFSPSRLRMTPGGSHVITPPLEERIFAKGTVSSRSPPIQFEAQPNSGKKIDRHITPPPARALFKDSDNNDLDTLFEESISRIMMMTPKNNAFVGTPIPVTLSGRLQRSGGRVLSYKEPSLKVKVRKGFKFYSFEEEKTA